MIGLGDMGSALARALVGIDRTVAVWNRTRTKSEPFAALGAATVDNAGDAVVASDVVVVCLASYDATHDVLGASEVAPHTRSLTPRHEHQGSD